MVKLPEESIPGVHDLNACPLRPWTKKKLPPSVTFASTWQLGKEVVILELVLIVLLERRETHEFFLHCNINFCFLPVLKQTAVKYEFPTMLAIFIVLAPKGHRCGGPSHPSYPSLALLPFYIWHHRTN
jgi:hypothetical protein